MGTTDPRIDAYIAASAPFAQPILQHIRAVVHAACPETEETMKWSFPHFQYRGGMLCSMASFKAHCAFGFWLGSQVLGDDVTEDAMGQFGRIASVKDLPSKTVLTKYIKKAMALSDAGVKQSRPGATAAKRKKLAVTVPPELAKALRRHAEARHHFEAFSPSQQREYTEWVAEAKREDTRERRVQQAIDLLSEGKTRNWKYESKP